MSEAQADVAIFQNKIPRKQLKIKYTVLNDFFVASTKWSTARHRSVVWGLGTPVIQAMGQACAHSYERVTAVVCLSDQGQISLEGWCDL